MNELLSIEIAIAIAIAIALAAPNRIRKRIRSAKPIKTTAYAAILITIVFVTAIRANLAVIRIILSTKPKAHPQFINVNVNLNSDAAIAILANAITLTPGTLAVDVTEDRKTIRVHALNAENPDNIRNEIKHRFENAVRKTCENQSANS